MSILLYNLLSVLNIIESKMSFMMNHQMIQNMKTCQLQIVTAM